MAAPMIIHQVWIQGYDVMPEQYKRNAKKWQEMNPDWKYMFWDDVSLRRLISGRLGRNMPTSWYKRYDSYTQAVLKSDFGRVVVLLTYGGVYLDTDTECCAAFDPAIHPFAHDANNRLSYVAQALMPIWFTPLRRALTIFPSNYCLAGPAEHPFWHAYLRAMLSDPTDGGSVEYTGPSMLKQLQHDFDQLNVETLPKDTFMLSSLPTQTITCGTHGYDSTWVPWLLRPIAKHARQVPIDLLLVSVSVGLLLIMRRSSR
jgi:mannosyltransferase OCH1-like enzyme